MHAATRRESRMTLRLAQLVACGSTGSDDWKRLQEAAIERTTSGLVTT